MAPDAALGTAADLLRMVHGAPVSETMAEALDAYLTVVIDNGLNASAFTARVIASTGASLVGAALGAYCAFAGPLHGGAPGPTLDLHRRARGERRHRRLDRTEARRGERLMGFGHRVFRDGDPRAVALRGAMQRLGPGAGRLAFAAEIEARVAAVFARLKPGRPPLQPNLEINAALLLDAVGIPREAFTPVFAVARSAGWLAHAMEQQRSGRLIRPSSAYIGPLPAGAADPA